MNNHIYVTPASISAGERAFEEYLSALACGPMGFTVNIADFTGSREDLAGALVACVRRGIDDEERIVAAASQFVNCGREEAVRLLGDLCDPRSPLLIPYPDGTYALPNA